MQFFKKIRIGQRAVKTALSVGIALAVAQILGSSLPIFAAIGAISVMSRTWSDSLKESLTQVAGTFLGYLIACAFVLWLPWRPQFFLWMAVGTLCVITLCIALRLNFAIPLASIVFADVCLYTGGDAVVYGFHRFTDTMVGLAVALVVNIVIRPYNNRQKMPDLTDTLNAEQVMGEATLQLEDAAEPVSLDTSAGSTDDYFAQMRLSRQSSRDSAVELLEETIAYDEGTTVGDTASQTLNRIVGAALSEAQIESLIIAKGFTDCVTYMADDTVSVAVSAPAEGLSTADVALISDVVTSQTDYDLSQVRVIEVKAQ